VIWHAFEALVAQDADNLDHIDIAIVDEGLDKIEDTAPYVAEMD
jgi:hypothetical protein